MLTAETRQRCEETAQQYAVLTAQMEDREFCADLTRSREAARALESLGLVVGAYREYKSLVADAAESAEMLRACGEEEQSAAQELHEAIGGQLRACERRLCLLLGGDRLDERGVIIELRCKGLSEASGEFTNCLQNMLLAFCQRRGWRCVMLEQFTGANSEDLHAAIVEVNGESVYRVLKHETGVHSGKWIPMFESAARAKNVSAQIVVMPQVTEDELALDSDDVSEELYFNSRHGYLRSYYEHIRLWHIPIGIIASVAVGPGFDDVARLRFKAETLLRARLHYKQPVAPLPVVRVYDWTNSKVKDAQTRQVGAIDDVMRGDLDAFVNARIAAEEAAILRACLEHE